MASQAPWDVCFWDLLPREENCILNHEFLGGSEDAGPVCMLPKPLLRSLLPGASPLADWKGKGKWRQLLGRGGMARGSLRKFWLRLKAVELLSCPRGGHGPAAWPAAL